MDKKYEKKYDYIDNFYWWTETRRSIIKMLVKRENINKDDDVLEIGCFKGALMLELKKMGYKNITGIDNSKEAIENAKANGVENVYEMDASNIKFDKKYDLVIASDVLEHIEDDVNALKEWQRILKPGGKAIIFMPAHKYLWSYHDEINLHFRRYNKKSLVDLVEKTGFKIDRISYWDMLLLPAKLLVVILEKFFYKNRPNKKDQAPIINPILNKLLILLLNIENKYTAKYYLPLGVSIFAILKKKD